LRWETTFTVDGMNERTSVGVKDRELFWQHLDGEIHTNEGCEDKSTMTTAEKLLLYPSPLVGSYRFEIRGATSLLDRAGWSVAGSRHFGAHAHAFAGLGHAPECRLHLAHMVAIRSRRWTLFCACG
jgi:hypothetical protein